MGLHKNHEEKEKDTNVLNQNFRLEEREKTLENTAGQFIQHSIKAADIATYHLVYPDGARDAEAFVLDSADQKFYLFTKREQNIRLYSHDLAFQNGQQHTLTFESELPFQNIVAADISSKGQVLLLKGYDDIYCYKDRNMRRLPKWLKDETAFRIPYVPEPQGESIAWSVDQEAFVTLSEQKDGITPVLYLFLRRSTTILIP
ncbi:MAG: hypothetical protein HC912_06920 [Saprospiraceae bacterium]|nr:hypothetical protein [Saprospiraceae bacterium]